MKKMNKKQKANSTFHASAKAMAPKSIRMDTVEMTESLAFELTKELLDEQYKEGGYLAFVQTMFGFVQRYDMMVGEAESLGQDEKMCRAVGASDIALTFIPQMRVELAKLEQHGE